MRIDQIYERIEMLAEKYGLPGCNGMTETEMPELADIQEFCDQIGIMLDEFFDWDTTEREELSETELKLIAASKELTVREQCDVLGFIRELREEQAKSGLKPL